MVAVTLIIHRAGKLGAAACMIVQLQRSHRNSSTHSLIFFVNRTTTMLLPDGGGAPETEHASSYDAAAATGDDASVTSSLPGYSDGASGVSSPPTYDIVRHGRWLVEAVQDHHHHHPPRVGVLDQPTIEELARPDFVSLGFLMMAQCAILMCIVSVCTERDKVTAVVVYSSIACSIVLYVSAYRICWVGPRRLKKIIRRLGNE